MSDTIVTSKWRCSLCSYVHTGPTAPETCIVCGAGSSDFKPFTPPAPATVKAEPPPSTWVCLVCGYRHDGAQPPEKCPLCGVDAKSFKAETKKTVATTTTTEAPATKIVIVGSGIAGVAAAEAARESSQNVHITLVSSECDLPYYRLNLTRYLANEINRDSLPIHPESWYQERNIKLMLGCKVNEIDTDINCITMSGGNFLPYDRLIISVGSHPNIPPLPGVDLPGVLSLRTNLDAEAILSALTPGMPCICIGGGVLGIETAAALAQRGATVTLLEGHDWLMPRQLNLKAAAHLERHLNKLGVTVLKQARTKSLNGTDKLDSVTLLDGRILKADLAILATGVRANTALARKAGIAVNNGVTVDKSLLTSNPKIYAAGDGAEFNGQLYGNWAASQTQGIIAGTNAAGGSASFAGIPRSNTIKAVGVDMTSIGRFQPQDGSDLLLELDEPDRYMGFLFRDNCMVGSVLVDHSDLAVPARRAVEERLDFSWLPNDPTCTAVVRHLQEAYT